MDASKENCRQALHYLVSQEKCMNDVAYRHLEDFLLAALKRLPSGASLARDRNRKRVKAKMAKAAK